MSSLRARTLPDGPLPYEEGVAAPAPGAENADAGTSYRAIARDPAVDRSTPEQYRSVGLDGDPFLPASLGMQTSELTDAGQDRITDVGRPGFFRSIGFRPRSRSLDREERGTLASGTIRRNVAYKPNGIAAPGFFSWAANQQQPPPTAIEPARPPQDEYLVSSLHLQLPDSLSTVVAETTKPAPGLEPFRGGATIQAQPSTGYPVLSPQIPSYGSRVPLRRPRGLVSVSPS